MKRHPAIALITLALTFTMACGGDDDGNSNATRYVTSCSTFCAELSQCSSSIDEVQCNDNCQSDLESAGPNLNTAFLDEFDGCVAAGDCVELLVGTVFTNACFNNARARTAATATLEAFCDGVAEEDSRCNRLPRRAACVDGLKIFSDASISRANACFDEPCDLQEPCVEDILGVQIGAN